MSLVPGCSRDYTWTGRRISINSECSLKEPDVKTYIPSVFRAIITLTPRFAYLKEDRHSRRNEGALSSWDCTGQVKSYFPTIYAYIFVIYNMPEHHLTVSFTKYYLQPYLRSFLAEAQQNTHFVGVIDAIYWCLTVKVFGGNQPFLSLEALRLPLPGILIGTVL